MAFKVKVTGRSGSFNEKKETTHTVTYQVISDEREPDVIEVMEACGIFHGQAHPNDAFAFARSYQYSLEEILHEGSKWQVQIEYGVWEEQPENPLDKPIEESGGFQSREVPFDVDAKTKKAVLATNGLPYREALMREELIPVLTIKKNEAYPGNDYEDLVGTVNKSEFRGKAAGTVRFMNKSKTKAIHQQYGVYVESVYELAHKPEGWKTKVPSMGTKIMKDGKLEPILDEHLKEIVDPVMLDEQGKQIPKDRPPFVQEWNAYPEAEWNFDF